MAGPLSPLEELPWNSSLGEGLKI